MSEEKEKKVDMSKVEEEIRTDSTNLPFDNQRTGEFEARSMQKSEASSFQEGSLTPDGDKIYSEEEAERLIRSKSRRSFLWAAFAVPGVAFGIYWLSGRSKRAGVQWPFRLSHEFNEGVYRQLYSTTRLSREFPVEMAQKDIRVNGAYGVDDSISIDAWELRLIGLADMSTAVVKAAMSADNVLPEANSEETSSTDNTDSKDSSAETTDQSSSDETADTADATVPENPSMKEPAVIVTLAQLKAMPKREMVTEFKCIEGWSYIIHWAGVPLVDVMSKYAPLGKDGKPAIPKNGLENLPDYVGMETNDGIYFVGFDMASAVHPQTLLCYEMNGKPLPAEHGGPVRLVCPTKYNIKSIKQIGLIRFTNDRPKDYWANEGYDWYSGH